MFVLLLVVVVLVVIEVASRSAKVEAFDFARILEEEFSEAIDLFLCHCTHA